MPASRPLLMFAFVKEEFDRTGDIVQGLMPLFAPIIRARTNKDFDPTTFSSDVNKYYGIRVHPYVAEDWAPRLARAGLLHPVKSGDEIIRYINLTPNLPPADEFQLRVNQLLDEFAEFIKAGMSEHEIRMNDQEIEGALFKRLATMEFLDILNKPEISFAKSKTLTLTKSPVTTTADINESLTEAELNEARLDVLCAAYALRLHKERPGDFDLLADIAGGALISEVVLGLRVPPSMKNDLSEMRIYFDSPLLLDLLNIGDNEAYDAITFLLDDLKALNAKLCTFTHCIDEMHGVLTSVFHALATRAPVTGAIGQRFHFDSNAVTRARLILADLPGAMKKIGVEVIDFDTSFGATKKFFSEALETELVSAIRPFRNVEPRIRDAKSIANLIRLTKSYGQVSNVFSLKSVFLTKNTGLANSAQRYVTNHHILVEDHASPFLTDRYLAGLLWVARGGAGDTLPKRKLIANCAAAARPRRDVITRMHTLLGQIDKGTAAEFEALMTDGRCAHYLMERSLGDAMLITPENASKLVDEIRRVTAEKVLAEQELEREQALNALTCELEQKTQEIVGRKDEELRKAEESARKIAKELDAASTDFAKLARDHKNAKAELAALDKAQKQRDHHLIELAVRAGRRGGLWTAAKLYLLLTGVIWAVGFLGNMIALQGDWSYIAIWTIISLFVTTSAGIVQFWMFPEVFFGARIGAARSKAFQAKVKELGISDIVERYDISWQTYTATERASR